MIHKSIKKQAAKIANFLEESVIIDFIFIFKDLITFFNNQSFSVLRRHELERNNNLKSHTNISFIKFAISRYIYVYNLNNRFLATNYVL